ncbi:uncharacterized protein LOC128386644 [Panonychus citri]|uniref:uncharacterized protein LOC128386644 n=1 Tax=Panonychus citri TaxID=50023 RepID=UPI00230711D4|nr:uncharacterized protein LOC128386644 [Panonychus citri]
MVLTSLIGLFALTVTVSGNFFGSPFPPMPNFPSFPSFPSSFGSDDFSSQSAYPGFNSFQSSFPSFGGSNGFGSQSFGSSSDGSGNNVVQTIKVEKDGPDGSKITETIEVDGPNGGSSVNRQSSSSSSSNYGSPVNVVHFQGGNKKPSSQGIAVGEPNPSAPGNRGSNGGFPSYDDFSSSFSNFNNGFFPSSTGISTAATSSSASNFVTSSSTKTNPDGSTVTETVTYDSNNPSKVTRVIKRIDANGKVTIKTV